MERNQVKKEENKRIIFPIGYRIYVGVSGKHECFSRHPEELRVLSAILYDTKGHEIKISLKRCPTCGKVFISGKKYVDYRDRLSGYKFIVKDNFIFPNTDNEKSKELFEKNMSALMKNKVHNILPQMFLTRTNVFYCSSKEHKMMDIKCKVKIINRIGKIVELEVPAAYCARCDKYYILEREYQNLKNIGRIVCKVVEQSFWSKSSDNVNEYNLNEESLLHMLGYNVNAQENLTRSQRWKILEIIVDEKILTRVEICSHLDYLLARSKNRKSFTDACDKWEEDRNHIINYNDDDLEAVEANLITIRKK